MIRRVLAHKLVPTFIVLGTAASCGDAPTGCTTIGEFAIYVDVYDKLDGTPAAFGALLIARDGEYADSTAGVFPGGVRIGVAEERPGTYTITVRKAGYGDWQRNGVAVVQGRCHVESQVLRADLNRVG